MPVLSIGTRTYEVSRSHVARLADRWFKMSPERRDHRVEAAKTQLAKTARDKETPHAAKAANHAAAVLLSQGISEI
jgi:hypothetical protein